MTDNAKKIAFLSQQLSFLQQSVSPEVWSQILLLEEKLIDYFDEAIELAYQRGYLEGLLQQRLGSPPNPDKRP